MTRRSSVATAVIAGIAAVGLFASLADARPGKGGSSGSRGSNTFSAPPSTQTAPGVASPMQKSITQPGQAGNMMKPGAAAGATAAAASAARPSMMRNLLLGGLMGAGLAMMFGSGTFASVMGFLLQTLLIGGVIALAVMFFRNRFGKPALATATPAASNLQQANLARQGMNMGGGAAPALVLNDADFGAFERLLGDIQLAYGHNDLKALETRTTPEMLSYFAHELDANRRNGVRNEISAPKLLQGDLSEAWNEPNDEYATVAMRYEITDATIDIASGRVVEGNKTVPQQIVELWTFRRPRGATPAAWELSAIQQSS